MVNQLTAPPPVQTLLPTPQFPTPTPPQNALRLLAVNFIGDILLFLGKVAIAAACGLIAFGMSELDYYNNAEKNPETYLSRWVGSAYLDRVDLRALKDQGLQGACGM